MEQKPLTIIKIHTGFALLIANLLLMSWGYLTAFININEVVLYVKIFRDIALSTNPVYLILAMLVPPVWWCYSTMDDKWDSYDRKNATLLLVIINDIMVMVMPLWTMLFDILVVRICKIQVSRTMTVEMIYMASRTVLVAGCAGTGYGIYYLLKIILSAPETRKGIEGFRITHYFDTRENKKHLYDLNIIQNKKTGQTATIKNNDRFVHMIVNGASGTGKTSSTAEPAIVSDLNKKVSNALERQGILLNMIRDRKAFVRRPTENERRYIEDLENYKSFENDIEAEYLVQPLKEHEKEYQGIYEKIPDCGITVMAPNASMNKHIIRLADARNITVNVIDPAYKGHDRNVRVLGVNPFYVPLNISFEERMIEINEKAQSFSQVLLAVNDKGGSGDTYFKDLNTAVTTNIAIICMLYSNMMGKQANIIMVQECINDFALLKPMVVVIEHRLHLHVPVQNMDAQRGRGNNGGNNAQRADADRNPAASQTDISTRPVFTPETDPEKIPEELKKRGISLNEYNDMLMKEGEDYYLIIQNVKAELLGEGGEMALMKMYDQVRGLRNIINKLLLDPRIKRILSSTDMDFIDWDRALAQNEITLINTALEYGDQGSTALGLFLLLNFKAAVVRRPEDNRSMHTLTIDEASQYMHPVFDDMFNLFRQYRVAVTIMLQSLSQMDKFRPTSYLKNTITGAGIHIVFGRTTPEEMKYYQEMAGIVLEEQKLTSETHNSEFDANYNITHQERSSYQRVNAIEGKDIRQRDFQEVTVYMIDEGRVLDSFIGKMSFVRKADFTERPVKYANWAKYFEEDKTPKDIPTALREEKAQTIRDYAGQGTVNNIYRPIDINAGQPAPYRPAPTYTPPRQPDTGEKTEENPDSNYAGENRIPPEENEDEPVTYTDYPYEGSEEYSYDEEYEEGEEEPEDKDTGDENLLSYMDENNGRNDDDILTLLNANKTQQ